MKNTENGQKNEKFSHCWEICFCCWFFFFFSCCFPLSRYFFFFGCFFEELLVVFPRSQKKKKATRAQRWELGWLFLEQEAQLLLHRFGLHCTDWYQSSEMLKPTFIFTWNTLFSMRNVVWILGFSCLGVVWGGGRFGSTWQRWWELQQHQVFRFTSCSQSDNAHFTSKNGKSLYFLYYR